MKYVEKEKQTIYNVFPMRSEVIPKHIRLDTTTLVHLLMTKKQGNKSDYLTEGNLKRNENKIWEFSWCIIYVLTLVFHTTILIVFMM